jgi:ornithine cyclodeaminase
MTKVITIPDLAKLVAQHGMQQLFRDLLRYLREDFSRWDKFHKIPRVAAHVPHGIIELMPIWDDRYYSYKYVNGHPNNPATGHLTVVALGCITDVATGYPLLLSEMTVLTGIRTAATSALASDFLARRDVTTMAVIGTGAQSEFQVLAHRIVRPIETVRYFDLDPHTMHRFRKNMEGTALHLIECRSGEEAVSGSGIIVTATAAPGHHEVVKDGWVKPGVHINGIGGDSPGKTELSLATLKRAKIFVEFVPQTEIEGEIQRLTPQERKTHVCGELWELVTHKKKGRESDGDITLYDSVGFALEDYSALRLVRDLSERYGVGTDLPMIPELTDPKDLISLLGGHHLR